MFLLEFPCMPQYIRIEQDIKINRHGVGYNKQANGLDSNNGQTSDRSTENSIGEEDMDTDDDNNQEEDEGEEEDEDQADELHQQILRGDGAAQMP